jgi:restriction system protein
METEKTMDSLQLLWDMVLALVQFMLFIWPITALVILMAPIRGGVYIYKTRRYAKAGIADIDKLNGKEFEQYLEVFFKKLGYQVKCTPYQGDYGADLMLQQGNVKTVVQAKRYSRGAGVKAVQEAVASKDYYHCDKAMVVTNSYFSRQAQTLAKANQVELWDRDKLVSRLLSSKKTAIFEFASSTDGLPNQQNEVQPVMGNSMALTCAKCGKQVSAKVREYCVAHADIFHGLSYCYDHQKEIRSIQTAQ